MPHKKILLICLGIFLFATPIFADITTVDVTTLDLSVKSVTTTSSATTGGSVVLPEGTNNGTNKITLKANDSIAADATVTVDSVQWDFGAVNLLTTGALHGGIQILSNTTSLTAAMCYGSFDDTSGTETITLPTAVVGMNIMIYSHDAAVKNIDPYSSEVIELNGTALTGGYQIKSPGAAGNFVTLICRTTGVWTTLGMSGTWVTNGS